MSTTATSRLPEGEVYDILRNDRRRSVIETLQDSGGTGTVGDLADRIAVSEAGESPPPRNVRQSVYVSLQQTHLPRLDDAGVVTFDTAANEVHLLDRAEEILGFLHRPTPVDESPPQTARYYLSLATVGCVFVAASLFGVPLFTIFTPVQWGLLSLVSIAALAGSELYAAYRSVAGAQSDDRRLLSGSAQDRR